MNLGRATRRLGDYERQQRANKAWNKSNVESRPPTEAMFEQAASQKTQSDTER
jgi:hypothetical protein